MSIFSLSFHAEYVSFIDTEVLKLSMTLFHFEDAMKHPESEPRDQQRYSL